MTIRDGPSVKLRHSAKAEGLGRLTARVLNIQSNIVCWDEHLLLVTSGCGKEMS